MSTRLHCTCNVFLHSMFSGITDFHYLQFQLLDLEPPYDRQCFDHVTVEGGDTPSARYCGTFSNFAAEKLFFSSVNGYLEVRFLSDMKISGKGFSALFYTLDPSG